MNDLISRQAAIAYSISGMTREIDGDKWIRVSEVRESLKTMPSALPKGHGRLIDADALIAKVEDLGVCNGVSEGAIDNAPTIIEADKEETK